MVNTPVGIVTVLSAAALLVGLAGCGTTEHASDNATTSAGTLEAATAPSESEQACRPIDVGALRVGGIADFEPESPTELAARVDVVVRATLVDIRSGYSEFNEFNDEIPYLIAEFQVEEALVVNRQRVLDDETFHLRLPQGPIGVETGEPSFDLDMFRESLPAGTDMVLFMNDITPRWVTDEHLAEIGLPSGSPVFGAGAQGMVVDDCGEVVGGGNDLWGQWQQFESLDQIGPALR